MNTLDNSFPNTFLYMPQTQKNKTLHQHDRDLKNFFATKKEVEKRKKKDLLQGRKDLHQRRYEFIEKRCRGKISSFSPISNVRFVALPIIFEVEFSNTLYFCENEQWGMAKSHYEMISLACKEIPTWAVNTYALILLRTNHPIEVWQHLQTAQSQSNDPCDMLAVNLLKARIFAITNQDNANNDKILEHIVAAQRIYNSPLAELISSRFAGVHLHLNYELTVFRQNLGGFVKPNYFSF